MEVLERVLGVLRRLSIAGVWVLAFVFMFVAMNHPVYHEDETWRQYSFLILGFAMIPAGIAVVNWIFTGKAK